MSLDIKTQRGLYIGFDDVWEDRVGEDESEDLPFANNNICLRDYGHGNAFFMMLLCGNKYCLIRVVAMLLFWCSITVQAQHVCLVTPCINQPDSR